MPTSLDSRIRAFWRQASAIVVAEGGLTSSCHAKLRAMAIHFRLNEEEFLYAFSKLQSYAPVDHELTRYEKQFQFFLMKELKRLPSPVLTLPIENRAIELAESKYQIDFTRARQLLDSACDQMNIRRISVSDAESFVEQVLNDELKGKTFLTDAQTGHLYFLAQSWGVEPARVDQFIEETLAANWRLSKYESRQRLFRTALWGSLAAAVFGVLGYWSWSMWALRSVDLSNAVEPKMIRDVPIVHHWWPNDGLSKFSKFIELRPDMATVLEQLSLSPPEKRRDLYRQLSVQVLSEASTEAAIGIELLCEILESDLERSRLSDWLDLATVKGLLENNDQPKSADDLQRNWNGWQLLARLSNTGAASFAEEKLAAEYFYPATGLNLAEQAGDKRRFEAFRQWSSRRWIRLFDLAEFDPTHSIRLVGPLLDLESKFASDKISGFQQANDVVLKCLLKDFATWEFVIPVHSRIIEFADDLDLEMWLEIANRQSDNVAANEIFNSCAKRSNVSTTGLNRSQIGQLLAQKKMELRQKRLKAIVLQNQLAENVDLQHDLIRIDEWLPDSTASEQPERIAQLIWSGNQSLLAIMMIHKEISGDLPEVFQKSFEEFIGPVLVVDSSKSEPRPLSANDRRTFRSILGRMSDTAESNSILRVAAVDKLASIAQDFDELEVDDANQLARYCLMNLNTAERISVEKGLEEFGRWVNFLLALADQVDASQLTIEDAVSILQIIKGEDVQFSRADLWKLEFAGVLRNEAIRRLESQHEGQIDGEKRAWRQLQRLIEDSYLARSQLLVGTSSERSELLASNILKTATELRNYDFDESTRVQQTRYLKAMYQNDFERVIPAQREFLMALAERLIPVDHRIEKLMELSSACDRLFQTQHTNAELFLLQENMILQITKQVRRDAYSKLMETGGF